MGVNLKDLVNRKEIKLEELKGKIIIIDTFNILFQFLTTIRSREGNLLTDSKGNITSHLIGLFSRTSHFLQKGIRPVFVFDGRPPELKTKEIKRRSEAKAEAQRIYEKAKESGNVEEMRKYSARTVMLTNEMIEESKKLLVLMGLTVVQAPSEGEAQASYMVKKGDGWCVASQDYDSLIYGASRLVQNLSIAGKRKKKGSLATVTVNPEMIELRENLEKLGITHEQLIAVAMLIGTDYNIGGMKGIGPKNALKLVKQYGNDFEKLFEAVRWNEYFETSWREIFDAFRNMPVTDDYKIEFGRICEKELIGFLVDEKNFNAERVKNTLQSMLELEKNKKQKELFDF